MYTLTTITSQWNFTEIEIFNLFNSEEIFNELPPLDNKIYFSFITYQNAKGQISKQLIDIKNLKVLENDYILLCYCHSTEEDRLFVASRIIELTDVKTGTNYSQITEYITKVLLKR